jgi:hypothetical protein
MLCELLFACAQIRAIAWWRAFGDDGVGGVGEPAAAASAAAAAAVGVGAAPAASSGSSAKSSPSALSSSPSVSPPSRMTCTAVPRRRYYTARCTADCFF